MYKEDGSSRSVFSGRLEKRGLYTSSCGKKVNANVNAAFSIARKCFGDEAFAGCVLLHGSGSWKPADLSVGEFTHVPFRF